MKSKCELYSVYFKLMKVTGILPYQYNEETNELIIPSSSRKIPCNLTPRRNNNNSTNKSISTTEIPDKKQTNNNNTAFRKNYCYKFTVICCITILFKSVTLFSVNYFSKYKYDLIKNGHKIQILWILGTYSYGTILLHQYKYKQEVAQFISNWLKLERAFEHDFIPTETESTQRIHHLKKIGIFYIIVLINSPFLAFLLSIFFPHFPPYITSILPKDLIWSIQFLPIRIFLIIYETYIVFLAWGIFASFDLLMYTIFTSLSEIIDKLKYQLNFKPDYIKMNLILNYCKQCEHLIIQLSSLYSLVFFLEEGLSFLTLVYIIYALLSHVDNWVMTMFYTVNGIALGLRVITKYLPIASCYEKSLLFQLKLRKLRRYYGKMYTKIPSLEEKEEKLKKEESKAILAAEEEENVQVNLESLEISKKLICCKGLVVRPLGLHYVTHLTILKYVYLLFKCVIVSLER